LAGTGGQVNCNLCGSSERVHLFTKFGYDLVECRNCGLTFVGNPPDPEAMLRMYSAQADYHNELLDPESSSSRKMRKIAQQHIRMLRKSVLGSRCLKLLDIGCSSGLFLDEARKTGFSVEGVELSPDTAESARKNFGLTVHTGTLDAAGFADETFDVITLFDVIEHLSDPLGELRKIRRLLRPGGVLLQSTPNIDGLFPRLSYKLAQRIDYWPHPEPPHHLYQFSVRTLTAMVKRAGLEPERVDQTRIQLGYSFGNIESWKVSPKLMAYAALFAPSAIIGPWIGRGDWLYMAGRRPLP
jgi:2-polyprenyl-3-methyl-5-hydroxy-6-metoxy-1,4-benzoquinol methylase